MKREKQSYMDEHIEGVVVCKTARTRSSTVLPTKDLREVPRLSWAVRRINPQAVRGRQSCPRNTLYKSNLQSAVTVMAVEYESLHPYYPVDAHINGYVANENPVPRVLATASTGCTITLGTVLAAVSYTRPALSKADRLAILWFFFCMGLTRVPILQTSSNAQRMQQEASTVSSRATLFSTMARWHRPRISSVSYGRNMRFLTRDILLRILLFCAWRP